MLDRPFELAMPAEPGQLATKQRPVRRAIGPLWQQQRGPEPVGWPGLLWPQRLERPGLLALPGQIRRKRPLELLARPVRFELPVPVWQRRQPGLAGRPALPGQRAETGLAGPLERQQQLVRFELPLPGWPLAER